MVSESLKFDDHLEFYKKLYAEKGEASLYVVKKAWHTHALVIFNPLRDLSFEAIKVADKLRSIDACNFLRYGAGRRLSAIWYSYRSIIHIAHAERTDPLTSDEAHEVNKDINLIYMHLRGVLDNFAWAYCYEKEPKLLKNKKGQDRKLIGLFNPEMVQESENPDFWKLIFEHHQWAKELSDKRDPVAHRIPLYVIPSVITKKEEAIYAELEKEQSRAIQELNLDNWEQLIAKQRSIGTLPLLFAHDPSDKLIPIYPTIPNDMAHLINIQAIVFNILLKK
jgi:hypothetical protein